MSILFDVDITDLQHPCALYVIRRLGLSTTIRNLIETHRYPFNKDTIQIGDVLFWQHENKDYQSYTMQMKGKAIIENHYLFDGHFAVYEGDDLVSDMYFPEDGYPRIRFRQLANIKQPTSVILHTEWEVR